MAWEVETALRKLKNWEEAEKGKVNIETLKAGDEPVVEEIATHAVHYNEASRNQGRKQIW